ncbi:MAG: SRPBCC domain-containing protein [Acidimicrobiales bacterium]
MSTNQIEVAARPEDVFSALLDPDAYAQWVVGTKRVRAVDPSWPAVGARFHHTLEPDLRDNTEIEELIPPSRLVLLVRFRPVGVARVTIELTAQGDEGRTQVTLHETPLEGPAGRLQSPPVDLLYRLRNALSLRRLARLVERRVHAADRRPAR